MKNMKHIINPQLVINSISDNVKVIIFLRSHKFLFIKKTKLYLSKYRHFPVSSLVERHHPQPREPWRSQKVVEARFFWMEWGPLYSEYGRFPFEMRCTEWIDGWEDSRIHTLPAAPGASEIKIISSNRDCTKPIATHPIYKNIKEHGNHVTRALSFSLSLSLSLSLSFFLSLSLSLSLSLFLSLSLSPSSIYSTRKKREQCVCNTYTRARRVLIHKSLSLLVQNVSFPS